MTPWSYHRCEHAHLSWAYRQLRKPSHYVPRSLVITTPKLPKRSNSSPTCLGYSTGNWPGFAEHWLRTILTLYIRLKPFDGSQSLLKYLFCQFNTLDRCTNLTCVAPTKFCLAVEDFLHQPQLKVTPVPVVHRPQASKLHHRNSGTIVSL